MTNIEGGDAMLRVFFRLLIAGDLLGIVLAIAIWIESMSPEQGANMVLMMLPMIAFPTLLCGLGILLFISAAGERFGRWERRFGTLLGAASLIIFGSLFALG
ncbi:MAG: hypothetical protein K8U03_16340 [Planctomycetia bacterium]|nr:hypothetical protein [Planctomycetia bacterium]